MSRYMRPRPDLWHLAQRYPMQRERWALRYRTYDGQPARAEVELDRLVLHARLQRGQEAVTELRTRDPHELATFLQPDMRGYHRRWRRVG